jgi:glycine cleavage system H lipoate-binding protein
MSPIVTSLEFLTVFVVGLAARAVFALLVVVVVFAVPAYLILLAGRGVQALRRRAWRAGLTYGPGHTWVRAVGPGSVKVGLDDLAQRLLAASEAITLPKPGTEVRAGEVVGVVRCGDKRGEIRAPIDGRITAVNETVVRDPEVIHRDPYVAGWLFAMAPREAGFTHRLRGPEADAWLTEERGRLARFLERDLGLAAADGGDVVSPAPSLLTDQQWSALTRTFLG